jgi:hypothetical protein
MQDENSRGTQACCTGDGGEILGPHEDILKHGDRSRPRLDGEDLGQGSLGRKPEARNAETNDEGLGEGRETSDDRKQGENSRGTQACCTDDGGTVARFWDLTETL